MENGTTNSPSQQRLLYLQESSKDRAEQVSDQGGEAKDTRRATEMGASVRLNVNVSELVELAVSHRSEFHRRGKLEDVEKAIEYDNRALSLVPSYCRTLSCRLIHLGADYGARFSRTGDINDNAKSIEYYSRAATLTPDDHPHLPHLLNSLGMSYARRFKHRGDTNDLTKSIEYQSRAIALTPENHPDLPRYLAGLGINYGDRFQLTGDANDFEKSMEYKSRAVALTPEDHSDLPRWLNNLGVDYGTQFNRTGDMNDLAKSTEYKSRAIELTPDDDPGLPRLFMNLGLDYSARFKRTGDMNDLEKSIDYKYRAVALTPDDHACMSELQFQLSLSYFTRYEHTKHSCTFHRAMHLLRTASQSTAGPPRETFMYALEWAWRSVCLRDCMEAYKTAINLMPQFIWLGSSTNQQYQDLQKAGNIAAKASSTAILSSAFDVALEWLEHARCVVWSQSLMLRSPLDRLYKCHPDIATQLQSIANTLHQTGTELSVSRTFTPKINSLVDRHNLAIGYNHLLAQIRTLDGFNDFLLPLKSDRLINAARHGPVVVIGCSHHRCDQGRCDALLVVPGQSTISHLHLPNFTLRKAEEAREKLEGSLRNKGFRERGVKLVPLPGYKDGFASMLLDLWSDIVKPVLDFLGYTKNVPENDLDLPHITWCPTGTLSFLPLHAAGDYSQHGCKVFNYVVSSYTPTLTALLASNPSTLNTAPRVLAVGQPNTPKHTSLPGTITELKLVKDHTQNNGKYSELINEQATTATVLDAMEEHDWVHFACYAHQNVVNATKSGFFLHDGTLDLAAINRRSFRNKGLAFLSACQTATGDDKLPDEAIHLASGMLMAGYPSVIATRWSVKDEDAPFVADRVYAELMKEGKLGNGEAGRALHNAVAALREKVGEKAFGRWACFIHIGS
ncbi:CHAT domain protein [Rhizoctonia solani]|uniref:CHAT domain protein n=1 Tax=Rhizoctonia solani TaxID=456999 RepID=A0A8H8P5T2_9AGAM|nr:CHAT domain protein [Rhizoctonia solani]QRW26161.1 CHAT domain protein [Rhizoctonia solani]